MSVYAVSLHLMLVKMNDQPDSTTGTTQPIGDADASGDELLAPHTDTLILPDAGSRLRRLSGLAANEDDTPVSAEREIVLVIRGLTEPVILKQRQSVIIGRADLKLATRPDIDLSRFGASERGVSREHVRLELINDRLYITDLGSTNGTFFKGSRLVPHQAQMIRRGEEIILGRLAVQIMF